MSSDKHSHKPENPRSWFERLGDFLLREPQDREQLVALLRDAGQRHLLDPAALAMIEGVLQISSMQVRDIMIPRSQIVAIIADQGVQDFLPQVIESGHSRFPVLSEDRGEVEGILLAKDLLEVAFHSPEKKRFNLHDILRPAVFVPESKRLNTLLQEFRSNRNHMAIVVNEYGNIAGLVTIEDILELIVGDIDDEYDVGDEEPDVKLISESEYSVKALTPIEEFNEFFSVSLDTEEYDTIGGFLTNRFGYVPKTGEIIVIDNLEFRVIHADGRRIRTLQVKLLESAP